jgi:SHAQKYF class myb-like DNA-binding protein
MDDYVDRKRPAARDMLSPMHQDNQLRKRQAVFRDDNNDNIDPDRRVLTATAYPRPPQQVPITAATAASQDKESSTWTWELHRSFVHSVFLVGISRSSPAVVTQYMQLHPEAMTAERIKSHLQKFRKNKDKSIEDFMSEYDTYLMNCKDLVSPQDMDALLSERVRGGELAAQTTLRVMADDRQLIPGPLPLLAPPRGLALPQGNATRRTSSIPRRIISVPHLSDEELQSPIGKALYHVKQAMQSMVDQIYATREIAAGSTLPPSSQASAKETETSMDEDQEEESVEFPLDQKHIWTVNSGSSDRGFANG